MTTMTTTRTTTPRPRRRERSAPGSPGRSSSGSSPSILIYVFREPIANVLLGGDKQDENLVALAGLQSGALVVFKICDITLWLERRPAAFLICDTARPLLGLVGADRLPGHRLGRRRGDDRDDHRHRRRRGRRADPAHRQLRAVVRRQRDLADHQARRLPRPDRDVVLADPERRHLHPLAVRRPRGARRLPPRLAARLRRLLPARRASGWGCARCANRPPTTPSRSSTARRPPAASCSPTSP